MKKRAAKSAGEYITEQNPQGYINNREITNLPGRFLVKGSKNCFILNGEIVSSRLGYALLGGAKTMNVGIASNFDWETNSSSRISVRSYYDRHEVWYKDAWHIFKEGYSNVNFNYATWWNNSEREDVLLSVNGGHTVEEWSGSIVEIASVTDNSLTKKGWLKGLGGAADQFTFADDGVNNATIQKQGGGFIVAGFAAGDVISISGSTSNNKAVTIKSVTDTVLTLIDDDTLTAEVSIAQVIVKWKVGGTWAEARALSINGGDASDRAFTINGVKYSYTGGESTGILTGLTVSPIGAVAAGDIAFQTPRVYTVSSFANVFVDLISVVQNQIFYGSTTSRVVLVSKNSDFTNFSESTLRIPGEGASLQLDSCPTALIPGEAGKQTSTSKTMYISAGADEWYHITFVKSTSNNSLGVSLISETTNVERIEGSNGSAAISQGAVVRIRNGVAVLTQEPTIDLLSHIVGNIADNSATKPISDPIKLDIESYDLTGAHGLYFQRNLIYTLPAEGVLVIRDFSNNYWQPPQTISISRLSVITIDGVDTLCGHSSGSNETYQLFTGLDDNGSKYRVVMAFGYENFGDRFHAKNFDEAAAELYISPSTLVKDQIRYDYRGATETREWEIDGADKAIQFVPTQAISLGSDPLGEEPLGSSQDDMGDLIKVKIIHQTTRLDFYERQRIFYSDSENPQFKVLSFGENVEMSDNLPMFIKE